MTTDELELERDLKTLAGPRAGDERLRGAIRTTLRAQLQGQPRSRQRRRLLGAAAVAAATLAATVAALVGTGGSGGPSAANAAILAHVVRAMSPPANLVVHVKEAGVQDGVPVSVEWWQETNPPYAIRVIKGAGDQLHEGAADGSTSSQYDAGTNTIYRHPDSKSPTLIDPIETVRAELTNGTAHVAGTVTIDGQSLYRIDLPNGVIGYFDPTDYRPVYLDNPQGDGSIVRTRVLSYEELPSTPRNEELLSLTAQHPDARVELGEPPASAGQS